MPGLDERVTAAIRDAIATLERVGNMTVSLGTPGVPKAIASAVLAEIHREADLDDARVTRVTELRDRWRLHGPPPYGQPLTELDAALDGAKETVVHACPPDDSGLMPCCKRPPFEARRTDRMTTDPTQVTCQTAPPTEDGTS